MLVAVTVDQGLRDRLGHHQIGVEREVGTVLLDGSVPRGELERMIDNSYALVVATLKKAERTALQVKYGAP